MSVCVSVFMGVCVCVCVCVSVLVCVCLGVCLRWVYEVLGGCVNYSFQRCTGFEIFRDFSRKSYWILEFRSNLPAQVCLCMWVSATLSESGSVCALM